MRRFFQTSNPANSGNLAAGELRPLKNGIHSVCGKSTNNSFYETDRQRTGLSICLDCQTRVESLTIFLLGIGRSFASKLKYGRVARQTRPQDSPPENLAAKIAQRTDQIAGSRGNPMARVLPNRTVTNRGATFPSRSKLMRVRYRTKLAGLAMVSIALTGILLYVWIDWGKMPIW
jgi:hypothetical protein